MKRNEFFCSYCEGVKEVNLSLMIDATNDCQLGCRYCYFGKKGGQNMDVEKVFAGIKNFVPVFGSKVKEVNFHYMGGEPLLAWDEILALNELGKRVFPQFQWSMTSNLIGLTREKADYMIREKAGIHCSIDGPADIHNHNRPYRGGEASFSDVIKNVSLALEITPDDTCRVTVCSDGARRIPEITETILGLGFKVVGLFPNYKSDWSQKSVNDWMEGISAAYEMFFDKGNISTIIKPGKRKNPLKRFTYCGAGKGLWAFDINGNLYFCHHLTNLPECAVINPADSSLEEIRLAIEQSILPPSMNIPDICQDCPVRNYCNGGCWADNFLASGNSSISRESECILRKATLEVLGSRFKEIEDKYKERESLQAQDYCRTLDFGNQYPNGQYKGSCETLDLGLSGPYCGTLDLSGQYPSGPCSHECQKCDLCQNCDSCQSSCEKSCQTCESSCDYCEPRREDRCVPRREISSCEGLN